MIFAYPIRNAATRPIIPVRFSADSIFRPTTFSHRESVGAEFAAVITHILVQNAITIRMNNYKKHLPQYRKVLFMLYILVKMYVFQLFNRKFL